MVFTHRLNAGFLPIFSGPFGPKAGFDLIRRRS
jgi:hypothetical protein